MKKIYVYFTLVFVFLMSVHVSAAIADTNKYIDIGLEQYYDTKPYININNKGIVTGYDIDKGGSNGATLNTTGRFEIRPDNNYYVRLVTEYGNYDAAKTKADQLKAQTGKNTTVVTLDTNKFYAVFGPYTSKATADADKQQLTNAYGLNLVDCFNTSKFINITNLIGGVRTVELVYGSTTKSPLIKPTSGVIGINYGSTNKRYRGFLEPHRTNGSVNNITMVNKVLLEQYLYGVVPSEMPASWNSEALKAQAVVARTYAYKRVGHSESQDGYTMCDTTHCQVYKGYDNEHPNATAAVNATNGIMAYYGSTPIDGYFHSSSGGATANSEDVWSASLPYIRGVNDTAYDPGNAYVRAFTRDELTQLTKDNGNNIGTVTDVRITDRDKYGRAKALTFYGTNGSHTEYKDSIRWYFTKAPGGSLKSTKFNITEPLYSDPVPTGSQSAYRIDGTGKVTPYNLGESFIQSATYGPDYMQDWDVYAMSGTGKINIFGDRVSTNNMKGSDTLTLWGSGYGHGLGMSQYGAKSMADKGKRYDEILKFYYTGITLK